jgi:hypothetical protein
VNKVMGHRRDVDLRLRIEVIEKEIKEKGKRPP